MQATDTTRTDGSPSFETVWAALQELAVSQKETDRLIKETAASQKETDRQIKDYNRRFGEFYNRFGEVVEYMIAPNLCEKFSDLGFNFSKLNKTDIKDRENNIFLEIDYFLENSKQAMLIEVRTKLKTEDVRDHIRRLEKMRTYADLHDDKRTFLGAVAGEVMTSYAKEHALKQGLFVVEPSGETFNITSPEGKPKEW